MASEAEGGWRSLEPASLLVNLIPDLWRTARNAWPLLLALFLGRGRVFVDLGFVALFFAMGVARTVVHFLTLRYRVVDGKLEIKSGLLARQSRVLDASRIQNMEIVQNVFHKLAGLVELRIDTAGEVSREGLLSAISVEEARSLRERLYRPAAATGHEEHVDELYAISALELVGYGVSAGRVGAAVLFFGVAMDALSQISPTAVNDAVAGLGPAAMVGLLLLALAGAYVLSVGSAILRHFGYRMVRSKGGLRLEGGLLTRRRAEIPIAKVQVVRVDEPWMRRLMGYATVSIETAAAGIPGETAAAEGMIPMVATDDLADITRLVLPRLSGDPWAERLSPPAGAALWRGVIGRTFRWFLLASFVALLTRSLLVFAVLPLAPVLAALDWRWQGWRVTPDSIVTRTGFLHRVTWVLQREKIQSVRLREGPLMRALGIMQVEVWVAGTRVVLPDLVTARAEDVFAEIVAGIAALSGPPPSGGRCPEGAEGVGAADSGPSDEPADGGDGGDRPGQIGHEPGRDGVS